MFAALIVVYVKLWAKNMGSRHGEKVTPLHELFLTVQSMSGWSLMLKLHTASIVSWSHCYSNS